MTRTSTSALWKFLTGSLLAVVMLSIVVALPGCDDDDNSETAAIAPKTPPLPAEFQPQGDEFLVAIMPDTQKYSELFPETFATMTQWIADYAEEYDIVFVGHVGDIVDNGEVEEEWKNAQAAYNILMERDIPHGLAFGNHDYADGTHRACDDWQDPACRAGLFKKYFGAQHYADKDWYIGASPSGVSSAQMVTVGDMNLLFLHLCMDVPSAEAAWALEILDRHPDAIAHVITHRYLYDYRLTADLPAPLNLIPAGRFNPFVMSLQGTDLAFDTSMQSYEFFNMVVAPRPNVWTIHCGHVDAEYHQVAENDAGLPVYEVLVDYQNMADGGGGWLRLLRYKPSMEVVQAITWSPVFGRVRENGEGFEHAIGLLEDYKDEAAGPLEDFGIDIEEINQYLEQIKVPGPVRDAYYESLYGDGSRDSVFDMQVAFQRYRQEGVKAAQQRRGGS